VEERPQVEFGKRSTHKVSQALYDQIRWNAVCGESCTHGVEPGKSWRSYQMLTYGYLVLNLRAWSSWWPGAGGLDWHYPRAAAVRAVRL